MTSLKITELILDDKPEHNIAIGPEDIILFVGPNNSGKSQALRDIYNMIVTDADPGIVVKSLAQPKVADKEHLESDLMDFLRKEHKDYVGNGYSIYSSDIRSFINNEKISAGIRSFLSSFQSTVDRLTLVTPPEKITEREQRTHPIHYIDRQRRLIEEIDKAFLEAFGCHLLLNDYYGKHLPLVLSDRILTVEDQEQGTRMEFFNEHSRMEFSNLPLLHLQGDGMKSFTGILLNFFVEHYSMFFIDEPESFLHPPQAYVMGKQIEALSHGKQVFIATHSDQLLKGLMDTGTDRLKIIRVTRDGNRNFFSLLDNEKIQRIWSDPLLRYSNIMNAIFYDVTVVTESNADCKFYKALIDFLMKDNKVHRDVFFVESGGKQRLHIICDALESLNMEYRVTPDFDIFRQDGQAKELYDSCGGKWDKECAADWKIIDGSLPPNSNELDREIVREKLNKILNEIKGNSLGRQDLSKLKTALKGNNKWDVPKYYGLSAIKDEIASGSAQRLMDQFHTHNIFPVPSGEMESLVQEFTKHGKDWVNDLLNTHTDLKDPIYNDALSYIASLRII